MKRIFKSKKILKTAVIAALSATVLGTGSVFGVNAYVKASSDDRIISTQEASELSDVDCIIVLGCRVNNTTPSPMLSDRLTVGVELYEAGAAPKILMSGDHGQAEYDEVNAMKQFAIDRGVPSEDIFMDHAGFSTYESMYRAAEVFEAEKVIIVTQEYHLYRAIYIAEQLGLEAYGVASDLQSYVKQDYYDMREVLARDKDFVQTIFKPEPTYLGETIPISGNGDDTNDKVFEAPVFYEDRPNAL